MDSTETSKIDFKIKMKERARLARRAAYEKQKVYQQERKLALKASPEFQEKQAERKAEQRDRNKLFKNKSKLKDKIVEDQFAKQTKEEALAEQGRRDTELLASLKPAAILQVSTEPRQKKPMLRLVKN